MESFADNTIHTISVLCSAQSAKTETMLGCLNWLIENDPGPCMWVTSNEEEALKFCTERAMPSLRACPKINVQMPRQENGDFDRRLVKSQEIYFPRMPLEFIGSNSEGKLQSKPRRWLMLDEVRNWPAGALPMVLKRTRAFWNARRVIISTPDMEHDAVHQEFLKGDQRHYYCACPTCGHRQVLRWPQMRWDENDATRPKGIWDFDELAKTIHYLCENPECAQPKMADHPTIRRSLAANGEWRAHNPSAPKNRRSYTWNAMLPPWVRWRDLVEEFIDAKKALDWGDHEPLKTFMNESMGEVWENRMKYGEETFLQDRMVDYHLKTDWELEKTRIFAVDVQKDHFRYVCRAFGAGGVNRLVDYGSLRTWEDVSAMAAELHVDPHNVVIDAAHRSTEVYKQVSASGYQWKAFWGDERRFFMLDGIRSVFTVSAIDPALGAHSADRGRLRRPINLYSWSNPSIKDMLQMMMMGLVGDWQISKYVEQEYIDQVTAERRVEVSSAYGQITYKWDRIRRDNHYWDCECMCLVAAVIQRLIGVPEAVRAEAEKLAGNIQVG